jgi:hypothetical protein
LHRQSIRREMRHFKPKNITMKMQPIAALICLASCLVLPISAKDDAPRGYAPLSELQEAQTKAEGKKLIVLVVKGMDDACPNCATALDNGERAVGSGVVKVFARAEKIREADSAGFTQALKDRIGRGFNTGASVTFVVFNPDMSEILAEASRKELQSDKKATSAFKKEVQAAKKTLK